eukprot:TRINITY_DN2775_c0_g1_i2.p2 TRINITY_DN2775_c0_g1~~TRINITY_DN2775_c0_g1_i2.p2  ORF type:complete len:397 (-),score=103.68 TRINITY_DN2775_c0_g1_i2:305-1495(-)
MCIRDSSSTMHKPGFAFTGRAVVTGGSGFVGQRLCEMLLERGASHVVSFDVLTPPADRVEDERVTYVQGDLRDAQGVSNAIAGADCVWHIAAAVGPFHPTQLYMDVNFHGTENVIAACKEHKVGKLVMSSSPSTRFDGSDVDGLTEEQMPPLPQASYLAEYARTKAMGELAVTAACCPELLTTSVAPHQVYGPKDALFLPNILEASGTGRMRIFGDGANRICFSHVDNYCHGLILGEEALYPGSPALGKFYIVTDGDTHPHKEGYSEFWVDLDRAIVGMGFTSIWSKYKLPRWLMMGVAGVCDFAGWLFGTKIKLNTFGVRMLTMHRWFDISAAETDLKYQPVIGFEEGWTETIEWFQANWLPKFQASQDKGAFGLHHRTQERIDEQTSGLKDKVA